MAFNFKNIIQEAKKGGKDLKKEEKTPEPTDPPAVPVPAELLVNVGNILNTINYAQRAPNRPAQESLRPATVPIDINGSPNPSGEPVLYLPRTSYATRVTGVPHAVSDVDHTCQLCKRGRPCNRHDEVWRNCNRCVRASPCKRHEPPKAHHTSVGLCDQNHCRMRVFWDVAHIDDSNTIMGLNVSSMKDDDGNKLECPRLCTETYRDSQGNLVKKERMCKLHNINERIKLLVTRMIEDYNHGQNKIQGKKENRPYIDARGRKYTENAGQRWGPNQPSVPTKSASTRASHKYDLADGVRLETEIRTLLKLWHRKKGLIETEGTLRKYMVQAWEKKTAVLKDKKKMEESGKKMPAVRMGLNGGILVMGTEETKDTNKPLQKRPLQKRPPSRSVVEPSDEDEKEEVEPVRKGKSTKESTNKRKAVDDTDDEDVTPPKKTKTLTPVFKDSEADKPTELTKPVIASPKHTEADLSIFEQLLDDVTNTDTNANKKPEEVAGAPEAKPIAKKPSTTTTTRAHTAEDSELLERMKRAAEEEPQGEEYVEVPIEKEVEEEDVAEPGPESQKAAEQTTTSPAPSPKSASRKRKTLPSAATQDPSKKTICKSVATITDSDDEADYTLPSAPALALPEQSEGWQLTESVSETSLKFVQTDHVSSANEDVVVEQGTTIVTKTEEEKVVKHKSPFVESEGEGEDEVHEHVEKVEKRKMPFVESEGGDWDEDEILRPVKKAKKLSFEEPVEEPVEGEIEEGKVEEGEVEEADIEDKEIDDFFEE
jgi:hypothetical protein